MPRKLEKTGGKQVAGRRRDGRFRAGESGNPAGRPRGALGRASEYRSLLEASGESVMLKLVEMATAGEPVALRLVVDRLLPARSRAVELQAPAMAKASDLVEAIGEVIRQTAAGALTLDDARQFAALLETQRKAIETADLAVRVEALEAAGSIAPAEDEDSAVGFVPLSSRVRKLEADPPPEVQA